MDKIISIVIPTLNSEATIEECLDSIYANKDNLPFELILVDGGSTDKTVEIAKKYPAKLLLANKPQATQRNAGISHATGDIIAFTDSDCRVKNDWLSTLIKHFHNLSIASVGGPNLTPEDDPFWAQCFGALMESPLGSAGVRNTVLYKNIREVRHNPPANSAVRKSVLQEVGGFGIGFEPAEDVVLDAKIKRRGYKLIYDPKMVVWHHRRRTLPGLVKQLFQYGRGRASVFIKYPESLPFTYFCVATFALGTILSIPLYIFIDFLRPVILFGWLTYFLFIILFSSYIAMTKGRFIFSAVLPLLAVIEHFILGLSFIVGLIHPLKGVDKRK